MTEVTDGSPVVLGVALDPPAVLEPEVEDGGVAAPADVEEAVDEESVAELAGTAFIRFRA